MSDIAQTDQVARRLVSGAALSVVRLAAVAVSGLVGTVVLARALGPSAWGSYSAAWSLALLVGAVLLHGLRDHLVRIDAQQPERARIAWTTALWIQACFLVAGAGIAAWVVGADDVREPAIVLACIAWVVVYPLRVPAMVGALVSVRPVRVMVLESIDAVVIPLSAIALLPIVAEPTDALACAVVVAATLGVVLGLAWGTTLRPRIGGPGLAWRNWIGALHLSAYQLAVALRELTIPALLLAFGTARDAGAYGIALPLGAMVMLALAAAAQPALGALSAVGIDSARAARLTNTTRALLATCAVVLVPAIWWLATPVIELMFGAEWVFATDAIALVMIAATANAALVPWANVAVVRHDLTRSMVTAQFAATLVTMTAAVCVDQIGIAGVAGTYVASQIAFGFAVARIVQRAKPDVETRSQLAALGAAALGIALVIAVPAVGFAGPVIAAALLFAGPWRASYVEAWRAVLRAVRK